MKWHDIGWQKYPSRRNNASHLVFWGITIQASLQVCVKKLCFDISKFSVMNLKETTWILADGELTTGIEAKKTAFIWGIGNLLFIFQHEITYVYKKIKNFSWFQYQVWWNSSNVGQQDGKAIIKYTNDGPDEYSAGYLDTKGRFEKTYGIFEVDLLT